VCPLSRNDLDLNSDFNVVFILRSYVIRNNIFTRN